MSASNVVKVNILGQDYFIKSSANQNYFKEISKYVNEKMQEIIDSGIRIYSVLQL